MRKSPPKLVHVLTSSLGVKGLLQGQLRHMRAAGFEVTVFASPGREAEQVAAAEEASFQPIPIEREIAPWRDLRALWLLWRAMRRERPAIVHAGTPKAGLLGGLAAWLAGAPCRVYTLYGLRLETARGGKRLLLTLAEFTSCRLAQRVVCVSEGLRRRAIELGVVQPEHAVVPASGSPNGVDVARFARSPERGLLARRKREALGIPQSAPVIGFAGRLTRDKGIVELLTAFENLKDAYPDLRLLLLGPLEKGDPIPEEILQRIKKDPRIVWLGMVSDAAIYYHLMDLLVLPSYREGFPAVILEAAAAGKPAVAFAATGLADAVVDGVTGILTPLGDVQALTRALARLLEDPALATKLGAAGRERAGREFQNVRLWEAIAGLYREMLGELPTGAPQARHPEKIARILDSTP